MLTDHNSSIRRKIAQAARTFQKESTGLVSKRVSVLMGAETLVITLHGALTPAEIALSTTAAGARKVQNLHRQIFATSSEPYRRTLNRITGRQIHEGAAEIGASFPAIVHAFTTGTMVQVFLFGPKVEERSPKKASPGRRAPPRPPAGT